MKWKEVPLPEAVEINPRRPSLISLRAEDPVTFVPMPAVSEKTASIEMAEVRGYGEVKKGFTYFEENDVLFAKITPCMENGKSALSVGLSNGIGFGSTEFHVLRAKQNILNPKFLHYFIRQESFRNSAKSRMRGAVGQQRVPKDFLDTVLLPLPPLTEQRRVVEILDQADELRKKRAEADTKAARILPAIFYKMFGDPVLNSKGWPEEPLGKMAIHITSGSRGWAKYVGNGDSRFLRTQDVGKGRINERLLHLTPPSGQEAERTRLQDGDVVITITGMVGKAAVFWHRPEDVYVSQHVALIRPREDLNPVYLANFVNFPAGRISILARHQYGQTKPGLGFRELKQASVAVPPRKLQDEFSRLTREIDEILQRTAVVSQRMKNSWNSLLHSAFKGNLTSQWREAHMKELLVEMKKQAKMLELKS